MVYCPFLSFFQPRRDGPRVILRPANLELFGRWDLVRGRGSSSSLLFLLNPLCHNLKDLMKLEKVERLLSSSFIASLFFYHSLVSSFDDGEMSTKTEKKGTVAHWCAASCFFFLILLFHHSIIFSHKLRHCPFDLVLTDVGISTDWLLKWKENDVRLFFRFFFSYL